MSYTQDIINKLEEFKLELPTYVDNFTYAEESGNVKIKASITQINDDIVSFAIYIDNIPEWLNHYNELLKQISDIRNMEGIWKE